MKLYYPQAMEFHGDNAVKHLHFKRYDSVADIDKQALFWCYFPQDYEYMLSHRGRKVQFWHGSDVGRMITMKELWPYLSRVRMEVEHVCHSELLQEELATIGIYAKVRPTFWNDPTNYPPCYKYSAKPKIYISSHIGREIEYGEGYMFALARVFPDCEFHVYGSYNAEMDSEERANLIETPDNLVYHGKVPEEQMDAETADMQICLRPLRHDGFSQTVMKALYREQYLITMIKYEYIPFARNFKEIIRLLNNYIFITLIDDTCCTDEYLPKEWTEQLNNFDWI